MKKKLKPKVSVLVAFYNASDYLDEAIQSILDQSFQDFELILVDDASTDNSGEVAKKYLNKPNIQYVKRSLRRYKASSLNEALRRAHSDLIAIMDGDDVSHPERLAKQYQFLCENPDISLVGTFYEIINSGGEVVRRVDKPISDKSIRKICFFEGPFAHGTTMYRTEAINSVGHYRNNYRYVEDIDLFYRLIYSGHKVANLPEYLYQYRQHSEIGSNNTRLVGKNSFLLKRDVIKRFGLSLSPLELLTMYAHFILDMTLTGKQKRATERLIKRMVSQE